MASIISVTLGVATMVVVNSVMDGFTYEMRDRIHGVLSDVVFEARSLDGAPDAERHMQLIRDHAGDLIETMSPMVRVPAMLGFTINGERQNRQVYLIGIDPKSYGEVSDVNRYLQHPANRKQLEFVLRDGGYDTVDKQAKNPADAAARPIMEIAGWQYRRRVAFWDKQAAKRSLVSEEAELKQKESTSPSAIDPFAQAEGTDAATEKVFDPATQQHPGIVLGMSLVSIRTKSADGDPEDRFLVLPGSDVEVTYPMSTTPPKPGSAFFTVVDLYESKMSEYDSQFVFVPLRKLQELRGMIDPSTGIANFNSIQIRCKPGADLRDVRDRIQSAFDPTAYTVSTWMDQQGPLLAAVQMELLSLNVLLFLILAVAGFGILATFFMIVTEKTRDIGILKSLGARSGGVLGIFLGYGLALGLVGAGIGTIGGLTFVAYIRPIADILGWIMGFEIFDPTVYYLTGIPTHVNPLKVALVGLGAMLVAVLASIFPAWRAAALRPVDALRWQ